MKHSNNRTFKPAFVATTAGKHSNTQTIEHSNNQTLKQYNTQTL